VKMIYNIDMTSLLDSSEAAGFLTHEPKYQLAENQSTMPRKCAADVSRINGHVESCHGHWCVHCGHARQDPDVCCTVGSLLLNGHIVWHR